MSVYYWRLRLFVANLFLFIVLEKVVLGLSHQWKLLNVGVFDECMLVEQIFKRFKHLQVQLVLHVSHFFQFMHQLCKYELISLDASFRHINFIWSHSLERLGELGHSGKDAVDLESVTPPGWVFIVLIKQIVAGDRLPVFDRFRDGDDGAHGVDKRSEESGLAAADIALNGVNDFAHWDGEILVGILFFNTGYIGDK